MDAQDEASSRIGNHACANTTAEVDTKQDFPRSTAGYSRAPFGGRTKSDSFATKFGANFSSELRGFGSRIRRSFGTRSGSSFQEASLTPVADWGGRPSSASTPLPTAGLQAGKDSDQISSNVTIGSNGSSTKSQPSLSQSTMIDVNAKSTTPTSSRHSSATFVNSGHVGSSFPPEGSVLVSITSLDLVQLESGFFYSRDQQLPEDLKRQWEQTIYRRLIVDLIAAVTNQGHHEETFDPMFCMAGGLSSSQHILLQPTVVITCRTNKCVKAIKDSIGHLRYLDRISHGKVRICLDDIGLAGFVIPEDTSQTVVIGFPMDFPQITSDAVANRTILTERHDPSMCGIKVCFGTKSINNPLAWHRSSLSTVGGTIIMDGRAYGLTTAHAVFWALKTRRSRHCTSSQQSRHQSDWSDKARNGDRDSNPAEDDTSIELECSHTGRTPILGPFSFAGEGTLSGLPADLQETDLASDFALLDLAREDKGQLINTYRISSTQEVVSVQRIDNNPSAGSVQILAGENQVIDAQLSDGAFSFIHGRAVFETRKILLRSSLGTHSLLPAA